MSVVFFLYPIDSADSSQPVHLFEVDRKIAKFMGVEFSTEHWCCNWYNVIGFLVAMGSPLESEKMIEKIEEWYEPISGLEKLEDREAAKQEMLKILNFMRENWRSSSYREPWAKM